MIRLETPPPAPRRVAGRRLLWWLLAVLVLAILPGCSGCQREDPVAKALREEEEKRKREEEERQKPKPDFEIGKVVVWPTDDTIVQNLMKPGHWTSAVQPMVANNFDFVARLETTVADSRGVALELERTPHTIAATRPAPLPKGQQKEFESLFFLPRRPVNVQASATARTAWLSSRLVASGGGREAAIGQHGATEMPSHQFFLVVLSGEPDRYGYLKHLESINPYYDEFVSEESLGAHYRVVLPKIGQTAPLPSHPLAWTSIAVLVWDDFQAERLAPDQQQALVDWLHFGGQLIVNGPTSLANLENGFLGPYLPATARRSVRLDGAAFAALNQHWSILPQKGTKAIIAPPPEWPGVGVELELTERGGFVPNTGELLAEGAVGRGRILVSACSLTDRYLINWPSFDSLFNACVLRRPSRRFQESREFEVVTDYVPLPGRTYQSDPRLNSQLRYFTRDMGFGSVAADYAQSAHDVETTDRVDPAAANRAPSDERVAYQARLGAWRRGAQSGVAGWNDFSAAGDAVRASLKDAAGIKVPEADFVLRLLALYLLVLAPANWFFFWMIGRVEWAWLAAPVIAIVGAVTVVRMAQLDIGFARSQTEIAVLETFGDFERAHLTRYTALYTSLSTTYRLEYDDASAVALPFSVDPNFRRVIHEGLTPVRLDRDRTFAFSGLRIGSNTTGVVHSEQMLALGGPLRLVGDASRGWRLENRSTLSLRDAAVLRKDEGSDDYYVAWLGEVAPGSTRPLTFRNQPAAALRPSEWSEGGVSLGRQSNGQPGEAMLSRLVDLAVDPLSLATPGEARLVAWTDEPLAGMHVVPAAPQVNQQTLVIVHLAAGRGPVPRPDVNLRSDVARQQDPLDLELTPDAVEPHN